ncbi:hypothetical protein PHYBOEH_009594 [Phytophthora boehmeriae]|uniref:RxLR effector protein n=1 Tax=Phytophthora boehmeriae TaxID=109152 RepID=A0A8T1X1R3_9STRA|nr:hypothetical protein PHYBOEH_009594 [Phytophthora boehmeriae]
MRPHNVLLLALTLLVGVTKADTTAATHSLNLRKNEINHTRLLHDKTAALDKVNINEEERGLNLGGFSTDISHYFKKLSGKAKTKSEPKVISDMLDRGLKPANINFGKPPASEFLMEFKKAKDARKAHGK